jgi:hypothetical protein
MFLVVNDGGNYSRRTQIISLKREHAGVVSIFRDGGEFKKEDRGVINHLVN